MRAKHVIEINNHDRIEMYERLERSVKLTKVLLDKGQGKDIHNELIMVRETLKELQLAFS